MRLRHRLLSACLGLLLPGCTAGLIYTHIVVPLDLNQEAAPEQDRTGKSDWKTLQYSFLVRIDWDTAAIADAARAAGITHIYNADMEILSVFGIWTQRTAIVYGTGPGLGSATPPPTMP